MNKYLILGALLLASTCAYGMERDDADKGQRVVVNNKSMEDEVKEIVDRAVANNESWLDDAWILCIAPGDDEDYTIEQIKAEKVRSLEFTPGPSVVIKEDDLGNLPRLTSLTLKNGRTSGGWLQNLTNLKELRLTNTQISSDSLRGLTNLELLVTKNSPGITAEKVTNLNLPTLTKISIDGKRITK